MSTFIDNTNNNETLQSSNMDDLRISSDFENNIGKFIILAF